MSEDKNFLHLPLDEIRYDKAKDQAIISNTGELGGDAIVHGNPRISYDPEVGTYMHFDGVDDFLELTKLEDYDFSEGFSFTAWVRFDALNRFSRIFQFATKKDENNDILFLCNSETSNMIHFQDHVARSRKEDVIKVGEWQHFAVTLSSENYVYILVDGNSVRSGGKAGSKKRENTKWKMAYIGKSNWKQDGLFQGAMAHLRIFKRRLNGNEVKAIMENDKDKMAHQRETTPLKMDLHTVYENDHKPVLFIESANKSHPLELNIENPHPDTPVTFQLQDPEQPISKDNFHIQLRFRQHVMSKNTFDKLQGENNKEIKVGDKTWLYEIGKDGREDYISFICTGEETFTLSNGQSRQIQLAEFNASAKGGSRNTRIEVRFCTDLQRQGSIIRHMEIHSHLGLKTIPLIAFFEGSNTILNDGATPNELTIKILNSSKTQTIELSNSVLRTGSGEDKASRFELIVDKELMKEYKLSAKEDIAEIDVKQATPNDGPKTISFEVQSDQLLLKPGETLVFQIENWITEAPTGLHNILLRYEDIEGYWDGMWVLPVEFSPLVFRNWHTKNKKFVDHWEKEDEQYLVSRVGIGTDEPAAKLAIRNGAIMPMYGKGDETGIRFKPDRSGSSDGAYIQYYERVEENARTLELGISDDSNDHIALMPSGNVGIGTNEPSAKLHVRGAGSPYIAIQNDKNKNIGITNYENKLQLWSDGQKVFTYDKVGIGLEDPKKRLHVKGDFRLDGTPYRGDQKWFTHGRAAARFEGKDGGTFRITTDDYLLFITGVEMEGHASLEYYYPYKVKQGESNQATSGFAGDGWAIKCRLRENTSAKVTFHCLAIHKDLF